MKKYVYLDAYVKTWEREARDNAGINAASLTIRESKILNFLGLTIGFSTKW